MGARLRFIPRASAPEFAWARGALEQERISLPLAGPPIGCQGPTAPARYQSKKGAPKRFPDHAGSEKPAWGEGSPFPASHAFCLPRFHRGLSPARCSWRQGERLLFQALERRLSPLNMKSPPSGGAGRIACRPDAGTSSYLSRIQVASSARPRWGRRGVTLPTPSQARRQG